MSRRLTARLCLLLLYWPFRNVIKSGLRDNFFIDHIFEPGLLFSLSTWTRPTFDHSEVKIGLYQRLNQVREIAKFTTLLNLLTVSIFTYGKRVIIHDFLVYIYTSNLGDKMGRFKNCYSVKE